MHSSTVGGSTLGGNIGLHFVDKHREEEKEGQHTADTLKLLHLDKRHVG